MNFFQSLSELALQGTLKLVIRLDGSQQMTVSLLLDPGECKDPAARLLPPLTLSGTADQLDERFFATIATPLQTVSAIHCDLNTHMRQVEAAKQQSSTQKLQQEQAKKAQTEKQKAYENAIRQIDELKAEKKYRQAFSKLPAPEEYPKHEGAIASLKTELMTLFTKGTLFG